MNTSTLASFDTNPNFSLLHHPQDADKVRLNDGSSVRLAALKEIRAHPREKSEGRARRDYLEDILTLLKEDPTDVSWYANADADAEKMPDLRVATKRAAEEVQTEVRRSRLL